MSWLWPRQELRWTIFTSLKVSQISDGQITDTRPAFLPPCRRENQDTMRSAQDGQQTRVRQTDWVCTHHSEVRKLRQEHGQFEAKINCMTKEEREGGRKKNEENLVTPDLVQTNQRCLLHERFMFAWSKVSGHLGTGSSHLFLGTKRG